ncbi:hypothetical protein BGX34_002376 [Mortierella sp. NVP85]|nr:hypothetical protein BGX34_002376 [Mortierella sp. NVP85]
MDSFKEFAVKDTHKHPDFIKMFSCFVSYIGRQRSNGISDASSQPNLKQCRKEYDEMLLQGSISVTCTTASNVFNHAIQNHGTKVIQSIGLGPFLLKRKHEKDFPVSLTASKYPRTERQLTMNSEADSLDDDEDRPGDIDIVTLAEHSNVPMGDVFHVKPFRFLGRVGDIDFGPEFDIYFGGCSNEVYDRKKIADFLSFAEKYPKLVAAMERRILKPTEDSIKEALATFRKWKDVYNMELRASDKDKARASMEDSHPYLIVKHQKAVDVGFGEISFEAGFSRDQGDLCRLCLWAKRALDQLQTEFEGLQDVDLHFVQVISKDCHIYQMSKFGTICVVAETGMLEIVQDLQSLLKFEDNLPAWLGLEKSFMKLLDQMSSCTPREGKSKATPCYPGLSTPSSRNMPH